MEILDLNAYGVEEITKQEEIEIDGGNWFADGIKWLLFETALKAYAKACVAVMDASGGGMYDGYPSRSFWH